MGTKKITYKFDIEETERTFTEGTETTTKRDLS